VHSGLSVDHITYGNNIVAEVLDMRKAIDLAGCWLGVATSGPSVFRYHWCLEQNGSDVVGVISLSLQDGSRAGSYRMHGRVDGNKLWFEGIEFIHNPGDWCMASGNLHHGMTVEGLAELTGSWGPLNIPGGCPPGCGGRVMLRRS
jgi:hypothetical protein